VEPIGFHTYCLDTLPSVYDVFHVWLLCPAVDNPLPGQKQTDPQPLGILTEEGETEYTVKRILYKQIKCIGRGHCHEYFIK
jgi:hypothetical protein